MQNDVYRIAPNFRGATFSQIGLFETFRGNKFRGSTILFAVQALNQKCNAVSAFVASLLVSKLARLKTIQNGYEKQAVHGTYLPAWLDRNLRSTRRGAFFP